MLRRVRVLIMGGGISGCSLWLALRQQTERSLARGWGPVFSATLYEQSKRIEAVGAGITLAPNGLRVLDGLGLVDKLKVLGGEVSRLHVYSESGQKLREFDCSFTSRRYGYPLLCMERAELQALLVHDVLKSEALQPVPGETSRSMLFGKRCVRVQDGGSHGGVVAKFSDGSEAVGDVLIGADGARSSVRAALYESASDRAGNDASDATKADVSREGSTTPQYSGISCLLGVTSSVPESIKGSAYWVLGKGRMYGTWSMGRKKQYWFLTKKEPLIGPQGDSTTSSSSSGARAEDGLGRLEEGKWTPTDAILGMDEQWNWFHPYDHHAMLSRTVRAVKVGFYEMPQGQRLFLVGPPRGGLGTRVAILGDAAHAMLPTVHQGANLAIEDAAALAQALTARCKSLGAGAGGAEPSGGARRQGGGAKPHIVESSSGDHALSECLQLALEDYTSVRASRVQKVAGMSRRTGLWQTSENAGVDFVRTGALKWIPHYTVERSLDWIYNYTVPSGFTAGSR